jgi:TPR repeat protein
MKHVWHVRRLASAILIPLLFGVVGKAADDQSSNCTELHLDKLRRQADGGAAAAQKKLGDLYAAGHCVAQDYAQAAVWFRRSAENGNAGAQFQLANYTLEGRGVRRDEKEAAEWFHRAAEQDFHDAQYSLGSLYVNGRGVSKDMIQGYMWFRLSAPESDRHVHDVLAQISKNMSEAEVHRAEEDAMNWIEAHRRREKSMGALIVP